MVSAAMNSSSETKVSDFPRKPMNSQSLCNSPLTLGTPRHKPPHLWRVAVSVTPRFYPEPCISLRISTIFLRQKSFIFATSLVRRRHIKQNPRQQAGVISNIQLFRLISSLRKSNSVIGGGYSLLSLEYNAEITAIVISNCFRNIGDRKIGFN